MVDSKNFTIFSRSFNKIVLRTPLLPDSQDIRRQILESCLSLDSKELIDEYIDECISSFRYAVDLSLSDNNFRKQFRSVNARLANDQKFQLTMKKYIIRASTRCTPSRLLAPISVVNIGTYKPGLVATPAKTKATAHPSISSVISINNSIPSPDNSVYYQIGAEKKIISTYKDGYEVRTNEKLESTHSIYFDHVYAELGNTGPLADRKKKIDDDEELIGFRDVDIEIDQNIVDRVLELNDILIEKTVRLNPFYKTLLDCYRNRYGDEARPLVEVFDHEIGICSHLDNSLRTITSQHSELESELTLYLLPRLLGRPKQIAIDEFLQTKPTDSDQIDAGTVMFSLFKSVEDGKTDFEFIDAGAGIGTEMFSRFALDIPQIKELHDSVISKFLEHSPFKAADILCCTDPVMEREICLRPRSTPYYFRLSDGASLSNGLPLKLSELDIGIKSNSFYVIRRETGELILPMLNSAHNFLSNKYHHLYRWLPILSKKYIYGFQWPSIFNSMGILPDVTLQGRVIKRRQVSASYLKQRFSRLDEIIGFLDEWSTDRLVKIGRSDRFLSLDLGESSNWDVLSDLVADERNFVTDDPSDHRQQLLSDGRGTYRNEMLLPFFRAKASQPDVKIIPSHHKVARRQLRSVGGDSNWVYVEWDCARVAVNRLMIDILEPTIAKLFEYELIVSWFFVRYRDPVDHIRLRFHCSSSCVPAVLEIVRQLSEDTKLHGRISDWRIKPYSPEFSRYGGIERIEDCHSLFLHSSNDAVHLMKRISLLSPVDSELEEEFQCAIYMLSLAYSMTGEMKKCFEFLDSLMMSISNSYELTADLRWARSRYHVVKTKKKGMFDIKRAPVDERIIPLLKGWSEDEDREILSSVYHMHCNRVMSDWTRAREVSSVLLAYRIASRLHLLGDVLRGDEI